MTYMVLVKDIVIMYKMCYTLKSEIDEMCNTSTYPVSFVYERRHGAIK